MNTGTKRAKSIFMEMVGKVSPDQWSSHLDVACAEDAELRRRVEELGISHCVELCDEVAWAEGPAHLAAADVLVLPSFYESFGLVLIEAMACGLTVVATRCGGPEQIVDADSGILVQVGDAAGLARGLDEMLNTYGEYDRGAVRQHVEEVYDYPQLAVRIHQVYAEILQSD